VKIGVYVPTQTADMGGGHTLVQDVTTELVRLDSAHSFVVFGHRVAAPPWLPAGASYAVLPKRHLVRRIAGRIRKELGLRAQPLTSHRGTPHVDLLLNAGPWTPFQDVPYVVTVWDLQHRLQPSFPEVSAGGELKNRERAYASLLPRAARVVVGTDTGRREVQRFYAIPDERIVLIPHPTPSFALHAPRTDPEPTLRTLGVARGAYVVYPAQFWPHKNHITVLAALAELRARGLELHAVFVGSDKGNLDHVRRTARELSVDDLLVLPGFVDRDTLVALYRGAFALTYASLFGPENLPPLEAFALGCPVIAARVAGAAEQLGDAAILVPGTDPAALAEALSSLRCESTRAALVNRGYARARSWRAADFAERFAALATDLEPTIGTSTPD
jgi:glycosyltransferase involved in cell wall biosynthesis